jgi:tetratricopeptide (TPR) repeat protein
LHRLRTGACPEERIVAAKGIRMRTPFCIAAFIAAMVVANFSFAGQAAYERHLARGIVAVEEGNHLAAEEAFRAALEEKPGDATATLYLGIALSRGKKHEAESVLKSAVVAAPNDPRAHYELGVHRFRAGQFDAAGPPLEKAVSLSPGSEVSRSARNYLDAIRTRASAKRWSANASVGWQYDTNVVLGPEDRPLPSGVSRKSDWRSVIELKGRYAFLSGDQRNASVGYRFHQDFHRDLSDFNVTHHTADLAGGARLTPSVRANGTYALSLYNLGGDRYEHEQVVTPSVVVTEGPELFTTVEYRWRKGYFKDAALFPNNSDRTGDLHAFGISQNVPLGATIAARVGYAHDLDRTRAAFWDYDGDKGSAGVTARLPYRTFVDLSGSYHRKRYDGVHPSYGVARRDTDRAFSAAAGISLADAYTLFASHSFTDSVSNIADLSYRRNVTGIFLNARY